MNRVGDGSEVPEVAAYVQVPWGSADECMNVLWEGYAIAVVEYTAVQK